ncbi:MAG: dihydrolipoyl dehydrogenase [Sphingobacteriales bacterium]|jgi:dihydrolipoamide dehydrogenase|nr:dihydrolipoyl dehydrogenase [Sphingobacteriales bacterium]MBP9140917.1 dihydrolipoyl dehydrogenase [Chitinophagales bacterium]MDA0199657.1 dihydrolipoyl dehydrogenase [Bacteroidota bacterium]MBK6889329.1 dihydrolipoyl dehydrogenase [Sphingobacteriales bacterium]MBK7528170.1 dihydrolipoyl dehydrogenase [Sphingobacteriales bacterium]
MSYQVIVIGSGPGGYVAAIRCAQLGFKTAIIEKYPNLGGTCLNVGCIPSKALLDSTEHYYNAAHHFAAHGIEVGQLGVNFQTMVQRKAKVVTANAQGVKFLMKKNKIDVLSGLASFVNANTIQITAADGSTSQISGENIIIATGSKPSTLPFITIDKQRIITSTEALSLPTLPKSMVVIGGGVIGCELGSVYARLGTQVTLVEYMDKLIASMDADLSIALEQTLKKINIRMALGQGVTAVKTTKNGVIVEAKNNATNEILAYEAEYCLVAIGRRPYTDGLALENAGLKTDERGRIPVNEHLQTNVAHIYAIGDVVKGAMLAHKAEEEGIFVAETIAKQQPHINYLLIPGVVYTWPEVAAVGYTEAELKAANRPYKTGNFPFKASGRARASMDTDGFVKVLADTQTDEILGVHIIGPRAADMIAEAVVAMEYRAAAEDIARISHAHPTYTEAFREACLAATNNRAIHI